MHLTTHPLLMELHVQLRQYRMGCNGWVVNESVYL